jgi:hypothetical protein
VRVDERRRRTAAGRPADSARVVGPPSSSLEWALGRVQGKVDGLTRELDQLRADRDRAETEARADKRTLLLVLFPSVLLLVDILLRVLGGR